MSEVLAEPGHIAPQSLDPFGFFVNMTSRVVGLGGNAPGHDPAYAFHTPYVAVARGPARFDVRFEGLQARRGTLVLRVHMLPDGSGAAAVLVNSSRIQLNRLVQNDGAVSIDFQGYAGFTYALLGQIPDQSDAEAEGLVVTLDNPAAQGGDAAFSHDEVRTTRFGSDAIRPTPLLLSADPPTLAAPVSQACTAEQMAEATWAARCRALGLPAIPDPDLWPRIFAAEVLRLYGLREPGVRGAVSDGAGVLDGLVASDAGQEAGAPDYLCSSDLLDEPMADAEGRVANLLDRLRPGGLAIVFLPLAHPWPGAAVPAGSGLTRAGLDRLALRLVSRRHEVAQIKPGGSLCQDTRGVAVFGLVLRRARSPI